MISLVCRNDERAFDLLFNRHHKTMYQYSVRLLKDADMAADIVQSVFVKLWEHKEYLSPEVNIKAYLYSMVRNRVVNYIRDNRARLIHNYRIVQENGLVEEVDMLVQFEDLLRHEELLKAMETLPPQLRKVLQFRFEGKTNRQIAPDGSYFTGGTDALTYHNPIQILNEEVAYIENLRFIGSYYATLKFWRS